MSSTHCDYIKQILSPKEVNCGILNVPENHTDPEGKKIQIAYIVLKARKPIDSKYPLIYISGGPGARTLTTNRIKNWITNSIRQNRDIILMDQRGIGFSSALPNMDAAIFEIMSENLTIAGEQSKFGKVIEEYKHQCHKKGIALSHYNSFQNAQDVGMLMKHLGYKKYNLYGVSYGTRLARIIQDKYPELIHTVIHNSPNPIRGDFLIDRLDSYSLALNRIFEYCENDSHCNKRYPNLKNAYLEGITGLMEQPLEINLNGTPYYINAQDGLYLIRRKLYHNDSRSKIPSLIKAFQKREVALIKELIQYEKGFMGAINLSMLLAVERYEMFDERNTPEVIEEHYLNYPLLPVKLGFFNSIYEAGRNWHNHSLPTLQKEFKPSNIPTLITVNQYDPVTPPENGVVFQKQLPNSRLFILDEGGHAGGNFRCRSKVMIAFMDHPNEKLNVSCLNIYKTVAN